MSEHDDFGTQLTRDLRRHAADAAAHPVSFEEVRRTAGRIRRRRVAATSVAVAVVAVGAPGGTWLALQGDHGADEHLVTAPSFHRDGPTPTLDDAGSGPGDGSGQDAPGLELDDLERGEAPRRDWLRHRQLHTADGRVLDLAADYGAVHRYDDGWLAIDYAGSEHGATAQVLDRDGVPVGEPFATSGAASSADGSTLLYMAGGNLVVHDNETGADTTVRSGLPARTEPVGVDDAGAVYYNAPAPRQDRDGRIWRDGEEIDPSPGAVEPLTSVNGAGFTTRLVARSDYDSCTAVFDPAGAEQARTCDFSAASFSPDGTRLQVWPAYYDGFGPLAFGILGSDWASPLVERVNYGSSEEQGDTFTDAVWEDDDHVLLTMADTSESFDKPTWYVVRIGVDGQAEIAAGPIEVPTYEGISLVR